MHRRQDRDRSRRPVIPVNPRDAANRERRGGGLACGIAAIGSGVLVLLTVVGCTSSAARRMSTLPSARLTRGLAPLPAGIIRRAQSGSAAAEVALGLRASALKRLRTADFWYRKAAAQGNAAGEYHVGLDEAMGFGTARNPAGANTWYRKAAEHGSVPAQIRLAADYYSGIGMARSYAQANFWFRKAAARGNAEAQAVLGYDRYAGRGIAQNYAAAVRWLRRAAHQHYAEAQYYLATAYFTGHGVRPNARRANLWYRRAAEQGFAPAEYGLGYDYALGLGTAQNFAKSNAWLRRAAWQGLPGAQLDLAVNYAHGRGVPRNDLKAFYWSRHAAARGLPAAQYFLGAEFALGIGTARNPMQAAYWLGKAAAQGYSPPHHPCPRAPQRSAFAPHRSRAPAALARHRGYTPLSMIRRRFPSMCGFYPQIAELLGVQGTAFVRICIDTHGQLLHPPTLRRSCGNALLDAAAVRYAAATSGDWRPERHNGVPINFCATLPVRFALRKPASTAGAARRRRCR